MNSNGIGNVVVREGAKGKSGIFTMANLGKTAMRTIDRGESRFTVIFFIVNERAEIIYVRLLT